MKCFLCFSDSSDLKAFGNRLNSLELCFNLDTICSFYFHFSPWKMMYSWHEISQRIHLCKVLILKFSCVKSLLSGQFCLASLIFLMGNLGIKTLAEIFGCQFYFLLLVVVWLRHYECLWQVIRRWCLRQTGRAQWFTFLVDGIEPFLAAAYIINKRPCILHASYM